ncbi:hypothetical protein [Micromonospora sp. IBHARD004]|uniref:hypothetical protein n=1 Tax=Micromonospora sp. IBHARD004 TaxID=3457764 RepID=UPI0040584387
MGQDGGLTIYSLGIETVARAWEANPDGPPGSSLITPAKPVRVRLIEAPIELR